jgi:hypothetical protein
MAYITASGPLKPNSDCKLRICARCSRQIRFHSILNHGVKFPSPPFISRCRASGLTQRQAKISSRLMVTASVLRPMNTEHSSFSAPVSSNCAWYWNLNRKCSGQRSPSSSWRRRWMAASMVSALRGWLQQLFDQYNGQRRFAAERCCSNSSPLPLKISNENARCRMPRPTWHNSLLKCPTP